MIVVTGATGNVGRPLVRALSAAGAEVTAVSRRPAGNELPPGVRHHAADLAEPDGLKVALDGADALFLLLAGELVATGRDAVGLVGAVRAGGVRQVVLLSSQGTRTRPGAASLAGLRAAEDAVRQSAWTGRSCARAVSTPTRPCGRR
ncbi:MAG: SDR family oxidoreductase [Streptosporangiaceae bacterium]